MCSIIVYEWHYQMNMECMNYEAMDTNPQLQNNNQFLRLHLRKSDIKLCILLLL